MKIAIVGTGVGEMEAPFMDESYEIWCMNWNTKHYPRATLDFEIHERRNNKKVTPVDNGIPTITQKNFPHEYIKKNLPRYLNNYFYKSSLDYMLAYAIYLHETKEPIELLEIYGVHMALDDNEYFYQQPSFHAWIGYALKCFGDIIIHEASPLMKSNFVYGTHNNGIRDELFNEEQFLEIKAQHDQAIAEAQQKMEQLRNVIQAHSGSSQAYDRLAKICRARASGQDIKKITDTAQIRS